MNHRHTLNGMTPRTVRDATRDACDWGDALVRDALIGPPAVNTHYLDQSATARAARFFIRLLRWLKGPNP